MHSLDIWNSFRLNLSLSSCISVLFDAYMSIQWSILLKQLQLFRSRWLVIISHINKPYTKYRALVYVDEWYLFFNMKKFCEFFYQDSFAIFLRVYFTNGCHQILFFLNIDNFRLQMTDIFLELFNLFIFIEWLKTSISERIG